MAHSTPTQGLKLYVAGDTNFEELGCATDLTAFDGSTTEVDTTTFCDDAMMAEPGMPDFGNVSFTLNYIPSDEKQQQMESDKIAGKVRKYAIAYPDESETVKTFMGWVSSFQVSASVNDRITADVTLRVYPKPAPETVTGGIDTADVS